MTHPTPHTPLTTFARSGGLTVGTIFAGLLAGGFLLSLTLMSFFLAAILSVVVALGLAWHWTRAKLSPNRTVPLKQTPNRFDTYQAMRRAEMERNLHRFDAKTARQCRGSATVKVTPAP